VTPDGEHVLTVDASAGAVHVHRRSSESGHLTYHTSEEVPSCDGQPAFPVSVTVSPDGASVYVSDFQEPSAGKSCISHWRRTDDGALIEPEIYQENFLSGIESVVITADGRHVYTAAFSANAVGHYERLPETGKLVAKPAFETTDAFGAEFAALSPDEAHLYVTNPGFHRVLVFSRDEGSGTLSHVQTVNEGGDALVRGAAGIAAALDGDHVYVVSRLDDALNVFRVSDDGSLVSEVVVSGLEGMGWPNGLVMTSDQRYLIVASVRTSGLSLFQLPE